jgi:hypothetical protein
MVRSLPKVAVFLLLVHGPLPSVLGQDNEARRERPQSELKQGQRPRSRAQRTASAPTSSGSELQLEGFGYDPADDDGEQTRSRQAFAEPHITLRNAGHYEISLYNDLTHQVDSHVEPREYMSEAKAIALLSKLNPGAPSGRPCPANSGIVMAIGWSKRQGTGHWGCDYFVAGADLSYGLASYSHDQVLQNSMKLYKQFAQKWDSEGWWGTNYQTIQVRPGQNVRAGQIIGFAGNTGHFLVDDCVPLSKTGIPVNPNQPNIHLHLSFAFFNSEARKWTLIDPYGVYSTRESGGYEPGRPTRFPSFFTEAMPPGFSGVPLSLFAKKLKRYADLGMPLVSLQIVSIRGGEPTVSGSFDTRGGVDFCTRIYTPMVDLWGTKDDWERRGYRPSKAWITAHPDGVERISAIWKKKKQGERFVFFMGDEQRFKAKFDELKPQGYRLEHRDPAPRLASNSANRSSSQSQQNVVAIFLIPGPDTDERSIADRSKSASSKKPPAPDVSHPLGLA